MERQRCLIRRTRHALCHSGAVNDELSVGSCRQYNALMDFLTSWFSQYDCTASNVDLHDLNMVDIANTRKAPICFCDKCASPSGVSSCQLCKSYASMVDSSSTKGQLIAKGNCEPRIQAVRRMQWFVRPWLVRSRPEPKNVCNLFHTVCNCGRNRSTKKMKVELAL